MDENSKKATQNQENNPQKQENETQKIERLLKLHHILSHPNTYNLDELADAIGIERRSIYRYFTNLRNAGFEVIKLNGYYRIKTEQTTNTPHQLSLTPQENLLLAYLVQSISNTNPLKQNLLKKLVTTTTIPQAECSTDPEAPANVEAITRAIKSHRQATLVGYASANSDTIRNRLVEPFAFTPNYVDVWCYDVEAQANKLFKIQRIQSVMVSSEPWHFGNSHRRGFVDVFRMHGFAEHPIRLRLGIRAHNLLLEEYPLAEKHIYIDDDEHWLLDTPVADFRGVARFVIGLADDIQIIESQELIQHIEDFKNKYLSKI